MKIYTKFLLFFGINLFSFKSKFIKILLFKLTGCLLRFQVDALKCYEGIGNSPYSGNLTTCNATSKYCMVLFL